MKVTLLLFALLLCLDTAEAAPKPAEKVNNGADGLRLSLSFRRKLYPAGREIYGDVEITNISDSAHQILHRAGSDFDDSQITIKRDGSVIPLNKAGIGKHQGGKKEKWPLLRDESLKYPLDIYDVADLSVPGHYTVKLQRFFPPKDGSHPKKLKEDRDYLEATASFDVVRAEQTHPERADPSKDFRIVLEPEMARNAFSRKGRDHGLVKMIVSNAGTEPWYCEKRAYFHGLTISVRDAAGQLLTPNADGLSLAKEGSYLLSGSPVDLLPGDSESQGIVLGHYFDFEPSQTYSVSIIWRSRASRFPPRLEDGVPEEPRMLPFKIVRAEMVSFVIQSKPVKITIPAEEKDRR